MFKAFSQVFLTFLLHIYNAPALFELWITHINGEYCIYNSIIDYDMCRPQLSIVLGAGATL